MKPFYDVLYFGQNLHSIPIPASRPSPAIPVDEIYSIQIHNICLDLLVNALHQLSLSRRSQFPLQDNVYKKRPKFVPPSAGNRPFRNLVNRLSWLPTPPTSLEKQQQDLQMMSKEEEEEEQLQITEVVSV